MEKCGICSEVVEKDDGIWISCDTIDKRAYVHRECYEKMMEEFRIEYDDSGRDEQE